MSTMDTEVKVTNGYGIKIHRAVIMVGQVVGIACDMEVAIYRLRVISTEKPVDCKRCLAIARGELTPRN